MPHLGAVQSREPESKQIILWVTEPGLGSAMAVAVWMAKDVVVVAVPVIVVVVAADTQSRCRGEGFLRGNPEASG